jgi:hypothetical protein
VHDVSTPIPGRWRRILTRSRAAQASRRALRSSLLCGELARAFMPVGVAGARHSASAATLMQYSEDLEP